jgi:ferredoxin/flavodoxin
VPALEVTLVVFTHTGTTLKVAEAMAEALRTTGHDVTILPTSLFSPDEIEVAPGGLVGLGAPTFYSRAPSSLRGYLAEIPRLDGRKAFVFATTFGASGRILTDLGQAARARGAELIGGRLFAGEVFHPAPSLHGRAKGRPAADDLQKARDFALAAADHVCRGASGPMSERGPDGLSSSRRDAFRPGPGFYELVGLLLTDPVLRRLLPEPVLMRDKCIRCGWCAEACPAACIAFPSKKDRRVRSETNGHLRDDYPALEGGCIRCYRCMRCPEHAYTADWRVADPIIKMLYHPRLVGLLGDHMLDRVLDR